MTISEHRRLRIIIATLSLFLAGAVFADDATAQSIDISCSSPSSCVPMTLNANVQITKLHPEVTKVGIGCSAQLPAGQWTTGGTPTSVIKASINTMAVVNRGYAGIVPAVIQVPKVILDNPANRTLNVTCRLVVFFGSSIRDASASAAQPTTITPGLGGNWHLVATGSTITWTQAVTIPNV